MICLIYLVRASHIITQFPIVFCFFWGGGLLNNADPLTPPLELEHHIWDFNHIFFNNFVFKD